MKKFLLHIGFVVLSLVFIAYVLNFSYDFINKHSKIRNKFQKAKFTKNEKIDIVVLGSSRANNHIDTRIFVKKGLNAFNYGISGSNLKEARILLEILLHNKNKIKNIILEADLNLSNNKGNEATQTALLSYLDESYIYEILKDQEIYKLYKEIPFYKYAKNEAKVGFREIFFTLIKKQSKSLKNNGFTPLLNTGTHMKYTIASGELKENLPYESIKKLCKIHGIKLFVITTPICSNVKGFNYFSLVVKKYPEIYNLENLVVEDSYFSSCGHLNQKGAFLFTNKVYDLFKDKFK